jgi:lysophospholipase L1-like esterase/pimeloyl-ACP methyl ester carboxylesterase
MKFLLLRLVLLPFFFISVLAAPAQDAYGNSPIRVACVGDSITAGVGASSSFNAYPMQLQRMLGAGYQVNNFGNSGKTLLKNGDDPYWTTDTLKQALDFKPNIVTIMLGTNDTKPQNWKFKDQFTSDYKELIGKFQALDPKPKIFVVRPPFVPGEGNYGINEPSLLEEIPMVDDVAKDEGLPEIDVHGATQGRDSFFPDRVHPNDDGAHAMALAFYQAITGGKFMGKMTDYTKSDWSGYEERNFVVDGRNCNLVLPQTPLPGNPWMWRTEFFGIDAQADVDLLAKGYYIAYMDVSNMYGAPPALDAMDKFYDYLLSEYHLNPKTVPEGFSRGGLYAFNWAARHPDRVACIYGDAPVCDIKSWPGGKGKGDGSPGDWSGLRQVYHFANEQEAMDYKGNPVDNMAPLAAAKIPILGVYGEADTTVPPAENILLVAQRYRALGGEIKLIGKPGMQHHPHSLADPTPIVDFVLAHAPEIALEKLRSMPPNLALHRPVTASSDDGQHPAAAATDGDDYTRWASQASDDQSISIDLGSPQKISDVKLDWEAATGKDYDIDVSDDGQAWKTVQAVTSNTKSGWLDYPGLDVEGRYLRVHGKTRATGYGFSLWEIQVFGR